MSAGERTSIELQQELCREIQGLLGSLRGYHRPDVRRTLFALAHVWLAIGVGFALAGPVLSLPPLLAVPAGLGLAAFMATRQNALNVLVHEGSHRALAAGARANDRLTNWGAGCWILFDTDSYRALHGRHHRHLSEPADPDRPLYALGRDRRRLARGVLEDLLGVSIARRARVYRDHWGGASDGTPGWVHAGRKLFANALLVAGAVAVWGPLQGVAAYALFWVFPLFSLYPVIIRLRLITEHFAPEVFDPDAPPVFVARTSVCGPIEHYLLGAQMDYHFEHHLFPGIPYHQLRRLHRDLVEHGFFTSGRVTAEHSLSGGYLRFWRRFLRSDWFEGARDASVPA